MIEIDGKAYYIDIDALINWVSQTPSSEKNVTTITTINYPITEEDEEPFDKEVSETKSMLNEVFNNIRYDVIRTLMNCLFNSYGETINISLSELTFGQKLAFNSLVEKKIIKESNTYYE